jgi:hypothetical protein
MFVSILLGYILLRKFQNEHQKKKKQKKGTKIKKNGGRKRAQLKTGNSSAPL